MRHHRFFKGNGCPRSLAATLIMINDGDAAKSILLSIANLTDASHSFLDSERNWPSPLIR